MATPRDGPSRMAHLLGVPLSPAGKLQWDPHPRQGAAGHRDLQVTPASALHQPKVIAPGPSLPDVEQHQAGSKAGVQESRE